MSDPLERLRDSAPSGDTVDVDAIRARAKRITRRRYVTVGAGGVAVAVFAVAGIFLGGGEISSRRIAQPALTPAPLTVPVEGEPADDAPEAPAGQALAEPDRAALERAASGEMAAGGPLEVTLEVDHPPTGRGAELTLTACNPGAEAVTRTFPTAKRYDFEVERDGEVVWRWSDDRAFAQVVGEQTWGPGECASWSEVWDATTSSGMPAAPGEYRATGTLATDPEQRTAPRPFCPDVC